MMNTPSRIAWQISLLPQIFLLSAVSLVPKDALRPLASRSQSALWVIDSDAGNHEFQAQQDKSNQQVLAIEPSGSSANFSLLLNATKSQPNAMSDDFRLRNVTCCPTNMTHVHPSRVHMHQ